MTLLSLLLLLSQAPEKVLLTYSGNDSTIVLATVRKSCNDSLRVGLTEYCDYINIIEVPKINKN